MELLLFKVAGTDSRRALLRWLGWYYVANWLLLILLSLRYLEFVGAPDGVLGAVFAIAMFGGHLAAVAALPFLLPVSLALLWPRRALAVVLAVVGVCALLALVFIDTAVFAQYRFHINGMVLSLLLGGAAAEIFQFSPRMWSIGATMAAGVLALQSAVAWLIFRWTRRDSGTRWGYWIATALAALFVIENGLYGWANVTEYTPITRQARTLPAYQPTSFRGVLAALGIAGGPSGAIENRNQGGSGLRYPLQPMRCEAPRPLPNILLIVVDSWRFDSMDARVSPNIAAFARDSWRFEQHFSGGNETRTGIFSLLYGLPATYWHEMLAERRGPELIRQALRLGYVPLVHGSAPLTSPEFDRTAFADVPGLKLRYDWLEAWERDVAMTGDFISALQAFPGHGKPFFGFLFYDTPHGGAYSPPGFPAPFQPSVENVNYFALNNLTDPLPYLNRYKNKVHFVDLLVGEVLRSLRRRGLDESTVVVITGDHGEEFNDNGLNFWGHTSNFTRYQTQVPFVLRWPGRSGRAFTHLSSHVDVAPTLMREAFGCENDPGHYSAGRLLTDESPRDHLVISAYNRFGLVERNRITEYYFAGLIEHFDASGREIGGSGPDPATVRAAMEDVSRFYAR